MAAQRTKLALTGLQWTLGLVILIEAILFVMPGAAHGFARTHMPNLVRLVLGFVEIAGCVLMLIPRTAIRGAWVLAAVFVLAIVIHLLHGMYDVGNLAIYTAAAWAVAVGKNG
ncbi:MAG: DoxX family protein [Candidatus Sulfotelmatobacter sp.]